VLEEERGERGLEQRREDVPVPRETVQLVGRDDAVASLDQLGPEAELARDDRAARPRDDVRADLRQPALRQLRIAVVERAGDRQLEDAVAEELEPLVRGRPIGRPRRMRERVVDPLRGQLLDQPYESASVAGRRLATGAR
jgi:hypothetical protein